MEVDLCAEAGIPFGSVPIIHLPPDICVCVCFGIRSTMNTIVI